MQAWISNVITEQKISIKHTKVLLFILCLGPLVNLVWGLLADSLGANPIETLTRNSGVWALRFLLLSLALTPIRLLTGYNSVMRFRRMLGLYAFFYALVHMLLYLGLDQFFDWSEIWLDILKRPFITIGFISFILLLPLTITSTKSMIKRLGGKRWVLLHKLVYLIAILSCVHFLMLVKADVREPVIYFVALFLLFLIRFKHRRPA